MNQNYQVPQIETKRCLLRMIDPSDASDLFAMRCDPKMIEYTDSKVDVTITDTHAYIQKMLEGIWKRQWYLWVIEDKKTNHVIGSISCWNFNEDKSIAEFGYGIRPDYQNQGLMCEVIEALTPFAFNELKLTKVQAYTEQNNLASCHLLEKSGFTLVDTLVESGYFSDKQFMMRVYEKRSI